MEKVTHCKHRAFRVWALCLLDDSRIIIMHESLVAQVYVNPAHSMLGVVGSGGWPNTQSMFSCAPITQL